MSLEYPWIEEEMIAAQAKKSTLLKTLYPADHKVGMEVPEGGSNCDKCEYLAAPQTCGEKHFIRSNNGSDKIPLKTSRFCCDFFQIK